MGLPMNAKEQAYSRPYRWVVLAVYGLALAVTQILALNFATLLSLVQKRYEVSELMASGLMTVVPLVCIFVSVPAGALIDSRGYRFAGIMGSVAMAVFSAVRIEDSSFWTLLAGQAGIAVAMSFIANAIAKVVGDWFSEEQAAFATGLCAIGLYFGCAVGMALTPALVESVGLRTTMAIFCGLTSVSALLFVLFVRPNEQAAPAIATTGGGFQGYMPLLRRWDMNVIFLLACVVSGVFNALTTWLEAIVAPRGITSEQAGLIGGVLILSGIAGSFVVPALSDRFRRRKPFVIGCMALSAAATIPIGAVSSFNALLGVAIVLGFAFMPTYALTIEMSGHLAGEKAAGAATSLVTLFSNIGGVLIAAAVPMVKGGSSDFQRSIIFLVSLMAICIVLAARMKETFTQAGAGLPASDEGKSSDRLAA